MVKTSSSRWLKTQDADLSRFAWQAPGSESGAGGYGAFSVSASHLKAVQAYIARQREHHQKVSFQDEFRSLLRAYDIAYDERYVWD